VAQRIPAIHQRQRHVAQDLAGIVHQSPANPADGV
jgi:hypothetical protein